MWTCEVLTFLHLLLLANAASYWRFASPSNVQPVSSQNVPQTNSRNANPNPNFNFIPNQPPGFFYLIPVETAPGGISNPSSLQNPESAAQELEQTNNVPPPPANGVNQGGKFPNFNQQFPTWFTQAGFDIPGFQDIFPKGQPPADPNAVPANPPPQDPPQPQQGQENCTCFIPFNFNNKGGAPPPGQAGAPPPPAAGGPQTEQVDQNGRPLNTPLCKYCPFPVPIPNFPTNWNIPQKPGNFPVNGNFPTNGNIPPNGNFPTNGNYPTNVNIPANVNFPSLPSWSGFGYNKGGPAPAPAPASDGQQTTTFQREAAASECSRREMEQVKDSDKTPTS